MNGPGFYKWTDGQLLYAPNFVEGPTFSLSIDAHATYTYPVDGWTYYADENAARTALGLPPADRPLDETDALLLGLLGGTQ